MDEFDRNTYLRTGIQFSFMLSWLPSTVLLGAADAGYIGSRYPHELGILLGIGIFTFLYFGYIFLLANCRFRRANVFVLLVLNIAVFLSLLNVLNVEGNVVAFSLIVGSIVGFPLLIITMGRHTDSL
jgi:succinate-acetate transporter protein